MDVFRVFLLVLAAVLLDHTDAQPIDKVDDCLLTCDYCFKGQVLLNCANECLLSETTEMNSIWTTVCPYFGVLEFVKR